MEIGEVGEVIQVTVRRGRDRIVPGTFPFTVTESGLSYDEGKHAPIDPFLIPTPVVEDMVKNGDLQRIT